MPLYLDYDLGAPQDVEDQDDYQNQDQDYAEDESNTRSPEFLKKNKKREKFHQKKNQIKG